jgi:hypothetical protein
MTSTEAGRSGMEELAGDRSARREVRNPVLRLPGVAALQGLDAETQKALAGALRDIQRDARERADKSWRTHKAPMALYWKAVGVYAGHLARVLHLQNQGNPSTGKGVAG